MTARRRSARVAGCLAAACLSLTASTATAFGDPAAAGSVAAAALAPNPDRSLDRNPDRSLDQSPAQDCGPDTGVPRISRSQARGTMPDTGAGRSLPPLIAAAGLLLGGLAFRAAAARLRRRESAR